MVAKRVERLRDASIIQIRLRRTGKQLTAAQPSCDQIRGINFAKTDRNIVVVGYQVHLLIGQLTMQADIRILLQKSI